MSDALIREAVVETARNVEAEGSFLEASLEESLERALGERFGRDHVDALGHDPSIAIPDWNPAPQGIDMVVRHRQQGEFRFAFELKIDDVDQTLWDIYKLISVLRTPQTEPVERAFMVVAAGRSRWIGERVACTTLYPAEEGTPVRWDTRAVFEAARKSWHHELQASGRPLVVAEAIVIQQVACVPITGRPGYELRAIEVRSAEDAGWVTCDRGWPEGVTPFRCDRPGCRACA